MFIKLLRKINVKKVIAFIILEIFILSLTPLYALQTVDNKVKKIILSYSYNEKENTLELSWNDNLKKSEKYYVFRKNKHDKNYILISDENGILKNHYLTSLKENLDSYFIVCKTKKFKELSSDIKIFSLHDKKNIELSLKKLRKSESLESNEILIVLNDKLDKKQGDMKSKFTDLIKTEDKKVSLNHDVKNKLDKIKEEISLAVNNDKDKNTYDDNTEEKIEGLYWINKNKVTVIEYEDIKLEIPSGSTPDDSYIYIKPLTEDLMVKTPSDSHNLTLKDGEIKGYDISLNGDSDNRFLKDIKISIKYDEKKIPQEIKKTNVFAYYYDENIGQWQYLKRDSLENGYITSTTDHFCQFYAGTMSVQSEPPQSKGINTDPINIEEVDPMAGIKGLPEVKPNNFGSASTSYPVSLPEGINDLTPKVSINYSSNSGEGNCGYGWNLGMSAITIDTKDGVPKYDGNDTLLLDGRELVKISADTYRLKNEGSFVKVVKSGDGFIVNHTDGKKMYYGQTDLSRLYDPADSTKVFIYYLNKIKDKFGNEINYDYEEVLEDSIRVNLYLKTIRYGYNNVYTVNFVWENRNDVRTNGRGTFLIINNKRLSLIDIKYKSTLLSKEVVSYKYGVFNKSLLTKIEAKNINDEVINSLSFEYDDEVTELFTDTITYNAPPWDMVGDEDLRYTFNNNGNDHTEICFVDINGDSLADRVAKIRDDNNFYVQLNTGDGFIDFDTFTVIDSTFIASATDLRYKHNTSDNNPKSHTEVDFIDINGDGLPDRVSKHRDNNDFYVQLNQCFNFTDTQTWTAPPWDVVGYEDITYSVTTDGIYTHTEVDFVDINGDGRPDRVAKNRDDNKIYIQQNIGNGFIDSNPITVNDSTFIAGKKDLRYVYLSPNQAHTEVDFVDINGDGLPDRVAKHRDNDDFYVQLNQGFNFTDTQTWSAPEWDVLGHEDLRYTYIKSGIYRLTEVDFVDINGDGLPDRVAKHRDDNNFYIQLNTGQGFIDLGAFPVNDSTFITTKKDLRYSAYFDNKLHTEVDFVDINGDGLPDRVAKHRDNDDFYIQLNNSANKNILNKITNDITGIQTTLDYERIYIDSQRSITFNYQLIYVLSSITTGNSEVIITNTFKYQDGLYDRVEREFRGFKKMTLEQYDTEKLVTHTTETTYRIDDFTETDQCNNPLYDQYIAGQIDTIIKSYIKDGDAESIIIGKQKNFYTKTSILTGHDDVKMVYPHEVRVWLYDYDGYFIGVDETNGDKSKEASFIFDYANGLISQSTEINYTDPWISSDDIKTVTDYVDNVTSWINMPYKTEKIDVANNTRISMKTIYYDDSTTEEEVTNGVLYREKEWSNNGTDPVTEFDFDANGNIISLISPDGLTVYINHIYSDVSDFYIRKIKTLPDGLTEIEKIDAYGRIKESTDIYGDTSTFNYDDYNRIISIEEQINNVSTITKTFSYEILTVNDEPYFKAEANYLDDPDNSGYLKMQFIKDGLGRMVQTKAEGVVSGNKVWIVSGKSEYDSMGRVTSTGSVSTADYTNQGLIDTGMVSPITYYGYDDLGRAETTTTPNGLILTTVTNLENASGQILSVETVSDSEGHEKIAHKDMLDQEILTKTKKADGTYKETRFEYDLHGYGKVIESDGIGEKQFDSIGRLMWMTSPDAGRFEYEYNSLGLVTKVTEYGRSGASSRVTNYLYDSQNRIQTIDYPGTTDNITYTYYDNTGEGNRYARSCIKNVAKGTYFNAAYDYGQLWIEEVKTIDGSSYTTKYEYDVQGRIHELTYPDGEIVKYIYDDGGFLERVWGNEIYVDVIEYDKFGQKIFQRYGNGTYMNYTYDNVTQLLDIFTAKNKDDSEILRYDYEFNIHGNITTITDKPDGIVKTTQTYGYDFSGRLISSTGDYQSGSNTYTRGFSYDNDNRILQKNYGNGKIYNYTAVVGTHSVDHIDITGGAGGMDKVQFAYDDFGNMTKKEVFASTTLLKQVDYTYNTAGKLTNLDDGTIELDFQYDAGGQRIKKVFEDDVAVIKTTYYVNWFYSISDGRIDKHISDGKDIVATKIDDDHNSIKFYHSNHIGSTAALSDRYGEKFQKYYYHPYGELWVKDENVEDEDLTHLFTGQEYDQESGLYYYNARYYDPDMGIFLSPDPAMDGLNHYAYANCNPVMYNDPTGMWLNEAFGFIDRNFGSGYQSSNSYFDGFVDIGKSYWDFISSDYAIEKYVTGAYFNDFKNTQSIAGVIGWENPVYTIGFSGTVITSVWAGNLSGGMFFEPKKDSLAFQQAVSDYCTYSLLSFIGRGVDLASKFRSTQSFLYLKMNSKSYGPYIGGSQGNGIGIPFGLSGSITFEIGIYKNLDSLRGGFSEFCGGLSYNGLNVGVNFIYDSLVFKENTGDIKGDFSDFKIDLSFINDLRGITFEFGLGAGTTVFNAHARWGGYTGGLNLKSEQEVQKFISTLKEAWHDIQQ